MKSFFTFFIFIFMSFEKAHALSVVIDPGHGGEDHGARSNHIREADLVLNVSLELQKLLEKTNIKSVLTRTSDQTLTLEQRVEFSKKNNADLFISIHANSSPNKKAQGSEFYFQNQLPSSDEMQYMAYKENQILKQQTDGLVEATRKADILTIIDDLKKQNRIKKSYNLSKLLKNELKSESSNSNPIRQAPFYVLAQNETPSVLIEIGYLTSAIESEKLKTKAYQKRLAQKIFQSIQKMSEADISPVLQ